MTRKRFVKLLMAQGVERNTANAWTAVTDVTHVPYTDLYKILYIFYNPLGLRNLGKMLNTLCCGLAQTFSSLEATFAAWGVAMCSRGDSYDQ